MIEKYNKIILKLFNIFSKKEIANCKRYKNFGEHNSLCLTCKYLHKLNPEYNWDGEKYKFSSNVDYWRSNRINWYKCTLDGTKFRIF